MVSGGRRLPAVGQGGWARVLEAWRRGKSRPGGAGRTVQSVTVQCGKLGPEATAEAGMMSGMTEEGLGGLQKSVKAAVVAASGSIDTNSIIGA